MNRAALVSFFLVLLLAACGGGSEPATGLSGTVVAPPGGDVAGTVVVACYKGNCDDARSRGITLTQGGTSAPYRFDDVENVAYGLGAVKDVNGNKTLDAGDYAVTVDALQTPPARVDLRLEVYGNDDGNGDDDDGTPTPTGGAVFPDLAQGTNGDAPVLRSDARGTLHLLYTAVTANSTGGYPLRYGTCAADCSSQRGWTFATVGDVGFWGGHGQFALDKNGRPRALYFNRLDSDDDGRFVYTSCDAGCADPANWTREPLAVPTPVSYQLDDTPYFAVAPDGTAAFVYVARDGTYYAYRNGARWNATQLDEGSLFNASLAFTGTSQPRLVFHYTSADDESLLAYLECRDKTCQDYTFDTLPVTLGYYTNSVLRLNASDAPRILHYSGETLQYLWCDGACTKAASWSGTNLGTKAGDGEDGIDLVLDGGGKPHISYGDTSESFSLFYGFCSAACESDRPSWQMGLLVEDSDDVRPEPPLPSCNPGDAPGSYWYADNAPSVTLTGGRPSFAYRVDNLQGCGGKLVGEGPSIVRFSNTAPSAVRAGLERQAVDSGRAHLRHLQNAAEKGR